MVEDGKGITVIGYILQSLTTGWFLSLFMVDSLFSYLIEYLINIQLPSYIYYLLFSIYGLIYGLWKRGKICE